MRDSMNFINFKDWFKPVSYPGMNIETNEKGIEVLDFEFDPKDSVKPQPWRAKWIWLDSNVYGEFQNSYFTVFCNKEGYKFGVARFRKEVVLEDGMKSIKAWVSADVKYRLFINGTMAGRGPAEVGGDFDNSEPLNYWFYDSYDFTHVFKPGKNVICAEVVLLPEVQADYSMGHGGFLFEAEIEYENGKSEVIATDNRWRAALAEAYISNKHFDARRETYGWMNCGYQDERWPYAQVIDIASGGRWNLIPREIPPLMEIRLVPQKVKTPFAELGYRLENRTALLEKDNTGAVVAPGAPFTFWLDFGKTLTGFIYLKARGPSGTIMTLGSEEIIGKTLRTETFVFGDGYNQYESFHLHSIRYLKITLSNIVNSVVLYEIGVNFISYPVSYKGDFKCSDSLLNKIYNVGRWTNQLCSQAYHMDSPVHQEALGCTGDYMIESLINYYTFGDRWLTRMDILRTAHLLEHKKGFMFHTSYSLMWIQMLVDYCQYTGDVSLYNRLAPVVNMVVDRFESYRGSSGLIENPPNYMFMDWVSVGEYNLHHPPRTIGQGYLTALYFKALKNAALISNTIGENQNAACFEQLADEVKQAFNTLLWVGEKGLYCDGRNGDLPTVPGKWLPEDAEGIYFSQHTNALAVLYGIAPMERHKDIMLKVFEDGTLIQAQPYFMHFVLEAAAHAGIFEEYGLRQIRRWKILLDENPTSLKEVWSGFDCDYSHAWGGTPTYQLPSKVLGIMPLKPGFDVIGIKPAFGDLKRAEGKVPTPKGIVYVRWACYASASVMEVSIPCGCSAVVSIPSNRIKNDNLSVNKEIIWLKGSFVHNSLSINGMMNVDFISLEIPEGGYSIIF